MKNHEETEIKLRVENLEKIKQILLNKGFKIEKKLFLERNYVFDTDENKLKSKNQLLRLRIECNKYILTFKKPIIQKDKSEYKVREEIEIEVSDFDKTKSIIENLGYTIKFIYEKYREIFSKKDIHIMLDKTPIGNFVEIEANYEDIDYVSNLLGFDKNDYINKTYGELFKKSGKKGNMTFND